MKFRMVIKETVFGYAYVSLIENTKLCGAEKIEYLKLFSLRLGSYFLIYYASQIAVSVHKLFLIAVPRKII
jgi:hypothetical protein